ncbi:unnamed protein product [Colias eurytheme]|nr:unnamed protein product [Colias eurytheme]
MADSTNTDISKMKVVDLRKELKARGLSYTGDKKELVARLQAATVQEDHGDINLDSDEIDSDGVLDDDDDKTHADILDDTAADTLNEDLVLEENSPEKQTPETKPQRILKRKITSETQKEQPSTESKDVASKKIVLNRTISMSSNSSKTTEKKDEDASNATTETSSDSNSIKITSDLDLKTRLELRAKRFGLPVKISDEARKEARKQRFGQSTNTTTETSKVTIPGTLSDTLDKLKKRSERFGQSVSTLMIDIENKEKLEKRKAKFGTVQ